MCFHLFRLRFECLRLCLCLLVTSEEKLLSPIKQQDLLPLSSIKFEDKEDGERKIDPKFIKIVCVGLERE